jgi:hypothetical protein
MYCDYKLGKGYSMIKNEIEELKSLSRDDLIKLWYKHFDEDLPNGTKNETLIKHIAWQMQVKKYGGYSSETLKQLKKLAKNLNNKSEINESDVKNSSRQILEIKSGTKLIREFKGKKHEVIVLDKGYNYNGRPYKSLSAIANEITGTRWNGKKFFGVAS